MSISEGQIDRTQLAALARRHLKSLAALSAGAGLAVVLGAAAQLLLARSLGASSYGVIVTANALANMLGPFAAFGVGLMLIQKHGDEGWSARRWAMPALRLSVFTTLAMTALFLAWSAFSMEPHQLPAAMLMAPFVAVFAAVQLAESRYQLEHDYVRVARWQVMKHAGVFTVAVLGAVLGWSLDGVAAGLFLAALVTAAAAFWAGAGFVRKDFMLAGHGPRTASPTTTPPSYRRIASESWAFAATSFVFLFFFQSSLVLVHAVEGARSAGVYGLAVSIMTVIYLAPRILYRKFFLAKVSRWYYKDPARAAAFASRLVPAIALLSLPLAVVLALAAPLVIGLAFGAEYAETATILQILALAVPFRFISAGLTVAAVETRHVRERVIWQFAIAAVAAGVILLLLPRYSVVGVAFVMTCAEVALAVTYACLAARDFAHRGRVSAPVAPVAGPMPGAGP